MKSKHTTLLLALATATALTCSAQNPAYPTQQPAPIQRVAPSYDGTYPDYPGRPYPSLPTIPNTISTQPAPGIFLRSAANTAVQTVSATADRTELRVARGCINLDIHHPAHKSLIQVDLPGGQTNILKDGLYTFNADSNTVSVLKGEAEAFPAANAKPIKIKEFHQLVLTGANMRSVDVGPMQASADLLPRSNNGDGVSTYPRPYGYGPYGDGYPFAYGYPYAYGYPFGFGLGFGYYGGFGGFRGGFRR